MLQRKTLKIPVSYTHLTLTDQEKKYSAYELQCLAIVFAFLS